MHLERKLKPIEERGEIDESWKYMKIKIENIKL